VWAGLGKELSSFFSGYTVTDCRNQSRTQDFDWEEDSKGGWHNALVCYSPRKNKWSWPKVKGVPPSPRAGAAAAVVGCRAFVFGGRCRRGRLNDLYCLHMNSMEWRQVEACTWPDPWATPSSIQPAPRVLHSFVRLPGTSQLALYGGLGQIHAPLQDLWLFESASEEWQEVDLPYDHGEVRCWQGAVVVEGGELLIHSGLTQEYYLTRPDLDDHCEGVLHLQLGILSLARLALDVVTELVESKMMDSDCLEALPRELREAVIRREIWGESDTGEESQYCRDRLRAGL